MKEILSEFNSLSYKHDKFQVFQDFCEMSAISIHNQVIFNQEKENRFLAIKQRYSDDEYKKFCLILSLIVKELEINPRDVLGFIFMELGIADKKYKGQCYTPDSIGLLCSNLCLDGISDITEQIKSHGYYRYYEPCIGSGSLVIGFIQKLKQLGYNYQHQLLVLGQDIDAKATQMGFIQLSLLGVPAIIQQADTLKNKVIDTYYTPLYLLQRNRYEPKPTLPSTPLQRA